MNRVLTAAFNHSAWASKTLIACFRQLTPQELTSPQRRFGGLLATLNEVVHADAVFAHMLTGTRLEWSQRRNPTSDLDDLEARVEEVAQLWESRLSAPIDGDEVLAINEGTYEFTTAVVVAQALHHGCAHRERIRQGFADERVAVPGIQPWDHALATGQGRLLPADGSAEST